MCKMSHHYPSTESGWALTSQHQVWQGGAERLALVEQKQKGLLDYKFAWSNEIHLS